MISQYIYDLLLDNDYVAVPGLGGFVCQHQSALIDRQRAWISPPARTIAFNKALNQNDGLLVQHVVLKDLVTYKDAEDKVREFVTQCNQQLHQIGSIQFPKIGRLYMDELKNIQFTPSNESLPLDDSFGLASVTFVPVSRMATEASEVVALEKEGATVIPVYRTQKRWPYWAAASFAGIFLMSTVWTNLGGQSALDNVMTAGMFSGHQIDISKHQHPVVTDNQSIQAEYLSEAAWIKVQKAAEVAASVTDITENPVSSGSGAFPIVVGAFKGPVTAEKYMNRLKEKGYNAELMITSPNTFIKVVINYTAENEEAALAHIRSEVEKDAWLLN